MVRFRNRRVAGVLLIFVFFYLFFSYLHISVKVDPHYFYLHHNCSRITNIFTAEIL